MLNFVKEYVLMYQDRLIADDVVFGMNISEKAIEGWERDIQKGLPNDSWDVFCEHFNPAEMPWPTPEECLILSQQKCGYLWLQKILEKMFSHPEIHKEWMLQASLLPIETSLRLHADLRLESTSKRLTLFSFLQSGNSHDYERLIAMVHPQSPLWHYMPFVYPLASHIVKGVMSYKHVEHIENSGTLLDAMQLAVHKNIDILDDYYRETAKHDILLPTLFPMFDKTIQKYVLNGEVNYYHNFNYVYSVLSMIPLYIAAKDEMNAPLLTLISAYYTIGHKYLYEKNGALSNVEEEKIHHALQGLEYVFASMGKPINGKIDTLKLLHGHDYYKFIMDAIADIFLNKSLPEEEPIYVA